MRIALSSVLAAYRVQSSRAWQMLTSRRDNIIGKLKWVPAANLKLDTATQALLCPKYRQNT
jgi:hypothetical protein